MKIVAHCIVKDEDRWVWFALMSIIDYVDKIIVYDTGSSDQTIDIIKSINSSKIILKEKGVVDSRGLVELRNEQIHESKGDWLLIIDGDEIWPSSEIKKLITFASKQPLDVKAIVNRTRNCVGDIYHYLPEHYGDYVVAGYKGSLNVRMIRLVKDLKVIGEYPLEAYEDSEGELIKQEGAVVFCDGWYLHTTYLERSSLNKYKTSGSLGKGKFWELGIKLEERFLPEVLYREYPPGVINPFKKRGFMYELIAFIFFPIILIKRVFK